MKKQLKAVRDRLRDNNKPTEKKLYMSKSHIQLGLETNQVDPETMRTINQSNGMNGILCVETEAPDSMTTEHINYWLIPIGLIVILCMFIWHGFKFFGWELPVIIYRKWRNK